MSKKNSNDTIGNRTPDLPAGGAVPQSTAPPAACLCVITVDVERCLPFPAASFHNSFSRHSALKTDFEECTVSMWAFGILYSAVVPVNVFTAVELCFLLKTKLYNTQSHLMCLYQYL
jgi:hypothetical protein